MRVPPTERKTTKHEKKKFQVPVSGGQPFGAALHGSLARSHFRVWMLKLKPARDRAEPG